jgi:hypothetical protein
MIPSLKGMPQKQDNCTYTTFIDGAHLVIVLNGNITCPGTSTTYPCIVTRDIEAAIHLNAVIDHLLNGYFAAYVSFEQFYLRLAGLFSYQCSGFLQLRSLQVHKKELLTTTSSKMESATLPNTCEGSANDYVSQRVVLRGTLPEPAPVIRTTAPLNKDSFQEFFVLSPLTVVAPLSGSPILETPRALVRESTTDMLPV